MSTEHKDERAIFKVAIKITALTERSAYLREACGNDAELLTRVEALLKAHEEVGDFLEPQAIGANVTLDSSPAFEGPGTKIGRYELLALIGEGGMGLVYQAEQKRPVKRRVALKIIKPGMDSKQIIARFEAERQALAVLDHPNIAHVFDAGTTKTGRPYFVMEHVKGMAITAYCDERKLNIEQRLRLFEQVCEGVHHAHQKGIIHRDLKPSNILVSVHGDRAVPKIIDFGIAKAITQPLTDKTFATIQGQLLGTLEYMSPEQVDLATQDIDTRSDIYALGVVLYELLSGVLPFERESLTHLGFAEVQKTIREQEPATPSSRISSLGEQAKTIANSRSTQVITLARRLHRELEWLPLKAMRKDRCRRYKSAAEMADDIRNYLNGNPLTAGPETAVYRARKFVHKHAGSVVTVALVAIAIILGFIVSTVMYLRSEKALEREAVARSQAEQAETVAQEQRTIAEEQRKVAEEQAEANRQALYFARVAQAPTVSKYMPVSKTYEILKSCPEDLRGWEWHYLWNVSNQEIMSIKGHDGHIYDIEWSPCGRYFASAGGEDNTARVWDAQTTREILTLRGHDGYVGRVTFSPDGRLLATANSDNLIRLYEIPNGKNFLTIEGHDNEVCCVAFDSSGKQLASGDEGGIIKVWDTSTGANKVTLGGVDEYVNSIAFRPGTNQIVASGRKVVRVWDITTQTEVMTLQGHTWGIRCIAVTPDGTQIASAGEDSMIKVWDTNSGKELMTLQGHNNTIHKISINSDGTQLVSAGTGDKMIKLWDLNTGQELITYSGHNSMAGCVAFSPDGERIVSGGADGEIKIWDVKDKTTGIELKGHRQYVDSFAFSPDGNSIVSCSHDSAIKLWDVASATEISTMGEFESWFPLVTFHPNGKQIALGNMGDGRIVIWDTTTKKVVRTISGHEVDITGITFSSDGQRLVTGSLDKTVKIWNPTNGNCELILTGHEGRIWTVSLSPDDKYIVSGGDDSTVRVWDASNGTEIMVFRGHEGRVCSVTFAPDSKRIISGGDDGTIRVWDLQRKVELMKLIAFGEHSLYRWTVAVSPDGKRIAYINPGDHTVVVIDAATGSHVLTIPIPGMRQGSVGRFSPTTLVFSPNGKTIALTCDKSLLLLESEVLTERYEDRRNARNARKLVDQLYADNRTYVKVTDLLRVDTVHTKEIREKALQISLSRQWDDLDRGVEESIELACVAGKDISEYRQALQGAQRANNSQPNDELGLLALGIAQYRVGAYKEAYKSLIGEDKMEISFYEDSYPMKLSFIAMTLYQVGHKEKAETALSQLRKKCENEPYAKNKRAQAFLREAEKLIIGEK